MKVPNQFTLRDWVNHYLFGIVTILILDLFFWNFSGIDLLRLIQISDVLEIIILLAIPYLIGQLFSGVLFSFLLRVSVNSPIKPISRFHRFVGKTIFGIETKQDGRLIPFADSDELNKIATQKVKNVFSIDITKVDDKTKREVFYAIIRYIETNSEGGVTAVERDHIRTNLFASMITVLLILTVLSTIALVLKLVKGIGTLSLLHIILLDLVPIFLLRIFGKKFQASLLIWWKNVWRTFLAVK